MYSKTRGVYCGLRVIWMVLVLRILESPNIKCLKLLYTKIGIFFCVLPALTSLGNYTFFLLWRVGISYGAERCELTLCTPDVN